MDESEQTLLFVHGFELNVHFFDSHVGLPLRPVVALTVSHHTQPVSLDVLMQSSQVRDEQ